MSLLKAAWSRGVYISIPFKNGLVKNIDGAIPRLNIFLDITYAILS